MMLLYCLQSTSRPSSELKKSRVIVDKTGSAVSKSVFRHNISFEFDLPWLLTEPLKLKESTGQEMLQFEERVCKEKVLLESCVCEGPSIIKGLIRVANLTYHKNIFVRYSYDHNWQSTEEVTANYKKSYGNYTTDQFEFELQLKEEFTAIEFVICYETDNCGTYWDHNQTKTYRVVMKKAKHSDVVMAAL